DSAAHALLRAGSERFRSATDFAGAFRRDRATLGRHNHMASQDHLVTTRRLSTTKRRVYPTRGGLGRRWLDGEDPGVSAPTRSAQKRKRSWIAQRNVPSASALPPC